MNLTRVLGASIAAAVLLWAGAAYAGRLEVSPDAPVWARIGADALLYLHIGGGSLGIISGFAAVVLKKGSRAHRAAGKVFLVSMVIAYAVGAGVAPFLSEGQRPNFIAGIMALYLLLSGWSAASRRDLRAGAFEFVGLGVALLVAGAGAVFMQAGANDPTGTVDGSPPQAFILFTFAGSVAAAGELNVIVRKTIAGAARLARHLWRMCFSWFIASGSFFLGQQQVMPEWIQGSPVLVACALAPLAAMVFWLVWVRFAGKFKQSMLRAPPRATA